MALDTYGVVWNRVLLRCRSAGPALAQDWVSTAFRRLSERRGWSWLVKQGQFILPALYNTGTATTTQGSTAVVGSGTAWTSAMIGRQFRIGVTAPIYTIAAVSDPTHLALDVAWGGAAQTNALYEIYQCFCFPPVDFNYFVTIWDPSFNWQLHRNIAQNELNTWDAQRSNSGQAYLVSPRDWALQTGQTVPLPRYEVWPHVKAAYVLPFLYVARATDLQDAGAVLPRFIRGDLLVEMALAQCASWPGPSTDKPNPYFNLQLAKYHEAKSEAMIMETERQDEEVMVQDVQYQYWTTLPWAPLPFGDSSWLQRHAI